MEKKKSIKKILAIIISILVILAAIFYFTLYRPIMKYMDTHTWATIRIVEEVNAETSDVFVDSEEYLKGDKIYLDSVTLLIEDITRKGVVTISSSEEVTENITGEAVSSFTIKCGESYSFKEKNGSVVIFVESIRYE